LSQKARQVHKPAKRSAEPVKATLAGPRKGKPVQFWLHEEDIRLISQSIRPTDSMVIRTALRVAKVNREFLSAYREAAQLDGRLKVHRKAS
jgi:hypothetical protein